MISTANEYRGTRFRLYPQPPYAGYGSRLETVTVSSPAGSIGPGPSDERMYTIIPVGKSEPYGLVDGPRGPGLYLPPWNGRIIAPPNPGPDGHFDHLSPSDPGFAAAHLFGTVRFTLDVWERYLGHPVEWHFAADFPRLELSMVENWANAHMGYGYLETGRRTDKHGQSRDYALNFDVIAHEVGHAVLVSLIGPFRPGEVSGDFEAFHEMSSDWVALIASLHFESVVVELLENTSGNLDTYNRFSRFGEIASSEQIRIANNNQTMRDYAHGWDDEHNLAKPLIGAFFDLFVDLYHEILLDYGAVPPWLERLADRAEHEPELARDVQRGFDRAFERHPDAFETALYEARDIAARFLVEIWTSIDRKSFVFEHLPPLMRDIDLELTDGHLSALIRSIFQYRNIGHIPPGPRIQSPGKDSHTHSARMAHPMLS